MSQEQCANCKLNFSSEKLRTIETEKQRSLVKSENFEGNKLCKFCWRQHIDAYLSQVCPCCQHEYPKYEFKEKYGAYCGRCFTSDTPKIKCGVCGSLNMGKTEKCVVCCMEEIDKLAKEISPLLYRKLLEPYSNMSEKLYRVPGDENLYRGRSPLEALINMCFQHPPGKSYLQINPLVKAFLTTEYRNGPIHADNDTRVGAYAQQVNDIWSREPYPYAGLIEVKVA